MNLVMLQSLLPQLILALGATAVLILGAWFRHCRVWLLVSALLCLVASLTSILVEPELGEVAGMFSTALYARFFTVLWALTIAATLLISLRYADIHEFGGGEYGSLLLFAAVGMSLLSAATSLLGLFLGLETFTLVIYVLIAFNRSDSRGAEAGLKYLVFGAVATGFMAFAIALIYAATGQFHIEEALAGLQAEGSLRPLGLAGWAMLLVAIGFKISLVPFHLWTPDVYQGAPAPISGVLATAAKGAVLAAFFPLLNLLGGAATEVKHVLWLLALITMLVGTFAALPQTNLKRMLAYSSVVHMGYLLIALLVGGSDGGAALLFYLVVYGIATFGAFGVMTSFAEAEEEIQDYEDLRGLGFLHPRRSIILAVLLLSLAGIPPLAGFFAKFGLFKSAMGHGYAELAIIGVFTSLVSVYYYLKPITVLFMQGHDAFKLHSGSRCEHAILALCLVAIVFVGLFPGTLLDIVAQVLAG